MAEKVTKMLIKVGNLQCSRCYRKIKKILCKFPQIRDQTYDEKKNTVLITVVCCSPEKIWRKIICKGGKTVCSVEILPPLSPPPKPKPDPPKPQPAPLPPKPVPGYPPVLVYPMVGGCCCPSWYGGGPCYCGWRQLCDSFSEENATACTVM